MCVGFLMSFGIQKLSRKPFEVYSRLHKIGIYLKFFCKAEKLYIISPKYGILSSRDKILPYPERFSDLSYLQKANFFYTHKEFLKKFRDRKILFVGDFALFVSLKDLCPKAVRPLPQATTKEMYAEINKTLRTHPVFTNLFERC